MTPLEDVTRKLRDLVDRHVVITEAEHAINEAIDDVIHEALLVHSAIDVDPPTLWQLRYMDSAGDWQVMAGLPGHIDVTVEQLRGIARLLIDAGAVEVYLQRSSPWHNVQTWEAKDDPGPRIEDWQVAGPHTPKGDVDRWEPADPFDAGLRDKPEGA